MKRIRDVGDVANRERATVSRVRAHAAGTPGATGRGRAAPGSTPPAPGSTGPAPGNTRPAPTRLLSPGLVLLGVLALALYFAVLGGDYSVFEARQAEARLAATRAEIGTVRHEIDSIRARIDSLRSSDEALERFAREQYGFIRDGEYLYRISEPEGAAQRGSELPEQAQPDPAGRSVIGRLLGGDGASGAR